VALKQSPVFSLFDGQQIPRPVCSSPVVNVTLELMDLCGSSYPEAFSHPVHMANLAESAHTLAEFEGIRLPFDLCIEAEALGCGIKPAGRESPPSVVKPAFENFESLTMPADIFDRGRFGIVFEAAVRLRKKYEKSVPIYGGITGPFTLAGHLCGTNKFLKGTIKSPDTVKKVLRKVADFNIAYANRLLEAGCHYIVVIDPSASGDLISERTFQTFLLPVYEEMHTQINGQVILHICGNTNQLLPLIAETGFEGFSFEGPAVSVRAARKAMGEKMILIGNLPTKTLLLGSPEDVDKEARIALQEKVDLLAPACGVALQTPLANMKAMVQAATKCGLDNRLDQ
jgi:[methyl-Co(III) methanol-specific corrinoid protein]:coenzyme M methyltransferase